MAEYLKIPEVAQRLDVSEKTVRRYVRAGELPSVFIGGAYRVSEEDLEKYLEAARVGPGDGSGKAQAPLPLEDQEKQWGPQALAAHINETAGALEAWSSLGIEKVEDPGDLPERAFLAFLGGLALALRSLERIKEIVDSRYRENGEILDEDVAKAWSRLTRTMHQFITPSVKRRAEELQDALPDNVIHMWDRKTA